MSKREPMFRRYHRFWRADPRRDVNEELAFHLEMRVAELQQSGMGESEAERATLDRFGDVGAIHSEVENMAVKRHARLLRVQWLDALQQDIRFSLRTMRASPGYTLALTMTLALGIGANLAILTIVNSVLLRPLPLTEPERIVVVFDDLKGAGATNVGMFEPELEDLALRSGAFDAVSATFPASAALEGGERVERIELLATSASYFELLRATPALGRVYGQADWKPGFIGTVVISDALWRQQFGSDIHIIGRTILLDEDPYTIIGVMPPDFHHPSHTLSGDVDVWAGAGFIADPFPSTPQRISRALPGAIARVKSGVSLVQAQQRLDGLVNALRSEYPDAYPSRLGWTLRIQPARSTLTGTVRPTPVAGGVAAVLVLRLTLGSLLAFMPADLPRLHEIHANWQVVVAALLLSLAAGVLTGIAPAFYATGVESYRTLKEGGQTSGAASINQNRTRSALVFAQIALSVVLLIAAGLLVHSFAVILHQGPGIETASLVTGQIWIPIRNNPAANKYLTPKQQVALVGGLLDALARLPGVQYAALGTPADVPMSGSTNSRPFSLPDQHATQDNDHAAKFGSVSPLYFDALKIAVDKGRIFTTHDDTASPNVVVVNKAFVRSYAPAGDIVGQRLIVGKNPPFEVIGVVSDVREDGLDAAASPRVYFSLLQRPLLALAMFVRSRNDAAS